jgi:hypothetical protein
LPRTSASPYRPNPHPSRGGGASGLSRCYCLDSAAAWKRGLQLDLDSNTDQAYSAHFGTIRKRSSLREGSGGTQQLYAYLGCVAISSYAYQNTVPHESCTKRVYKG